VNLVAAEVMVDWKPTEQTINILSFLFFTNMYTEISL